MWPFRPALPSHDCLSSQQLSPKRYRNTDNIICLDFGFPSDLFRGRNPELVSDPGIYFGCRNYFGRRMCSRSNLGTKEQMSGQLSCTSNVHNQISFILYCKVFPCAGNAPHSKSAMVKQFRILTLNRKLDGLPLLWLYTEYYSLISPGLATQLLHCFTLLITVQLSPCFIVYTFKVSSLS